MEPSSNDPASAIPWSAVTERLQARFGHWLQVNVAEPPRTSDGYVIHCDPERVSGAPVFVGTRVPVAILVDHLAHGSTLDEFLDDFPSVTREQAIAFLLQSAEALLERIGAPLPSVDREPPPLTTAQRNELDCRIESYQQYPSRVIPAEEVFRELRESFG